MYYAVWLLEHSKVVTRSLAMAFLLALCYEVILSQWIRLFSIFI